MCVMTARKCLGTYGCAQSGTLSPASVRRKWRSGVYVCRADVEDVSRCDRVVKAMQENRALFIFVRATPTKFLNINCYCDKSVKLFNSVVFPSAMR